MNMRPKAFAVGMILASLVVASVADASAINGTRITTINLIGTQSAFIGFTFANGGAPACAIATSGLYVDVTTAKGKAALSLATAALLANVVVDATGTGTCTQPSGGFAGENLASLNIHSQ